MNEFSNNYKAIQRNKIEKYLAAQELLAKTLGLDQEINNVIVTPDYIEVLKPVDFEV